MCGKECLKDLLTDCLDERMYDWNDARMEYCTQAEGMSDRLVMCSNDRQTEWIRYRITAYIQSFLTYWNTESD